MSVPCVVLASAPIDGSNWSKFEASLKPFGEGQAPVDNGYDVFFKVALSQDGGNGGGGEPGGAGKQMKPVLGVHRRGAWDFQESNDDPDWHKRYPHPMRFEVCLPFDDISLASYFLKKDTLGIAISNNFVNVMIVPVTQRV